MQAGSENLNNEETLKKLIAIELVFVLRLKIRSLIQRLQQPFTAATYKSQEDALLFSQINTLLCQEPLQNYLNSSSSSCFRFFLDTLKQLTQLQHTKDAKIQQNPTSKIPINFDDRTVEKLKGLENTLAEQTASIDKDYESLLLFLGKDVSNQSYHPLRRQVFDAQYLSDLIAVVENNPDKVHQIAAILFDDMLIFSIRFMHYDEYLFFHLMRQFPPSFQSAVDLYMELRLTPNLESNYHLDQVLKTFLQQHQIVLINPFKFLLEPQDPVFFYLDRPEYSSLSPELEIAQIKIAMLNIKQDQRFITKGSKDHLNQAGIDLCFYLEEKLERLREKLPLITQNTEEPLAIADRSFIYYQPKHSHPTPIANLDNPTNKPGGDPSLHRLEKLKQPREKVMTVAKVIKAVLTHFKEDFLAVYGFDGFEITAHKATADIEVRPYRGTLLPLGLVICSFLGLPTRAAHFTRHDPLQLNPKTNLPYEPNYSPNFDFLQLLRNFIGGWVIIRDKRNWQWTPKKKAQIILLPFKIFVILPVKIIAVPCKFFLNILKLFTELLPTVCVDGLRTAYKSLFKLAIKVFDYKKAAGLNILPAILIGLASVAVICVFVLMNIVKKIGIAWTSPEKSARMAFNYGRKFILGLSEDSETNEDVAFAFGVILGFVSIIATAISWAIFLPLTLATLSTYFPALIQAVIWVLQFPLISTAFAALQSSLLSLGTFLGTSVTFGWIVSSLATLIGVQVSTVVLIASTAVAFIAPPITAIISRLAEGFSNSWARWGNTPEPTLKIKEPFFDNRADTLESALMLDKKRHLAVAPSEGTVANSRPPSPKPRSLVDSSLRDSTAALNLSQSADRLDIALTKIPSTTTPTLSSTQKSSDNQQFKPDTSVV